MSLFTCSTFGSQTLLNGSKEQSNFLVAVLTQPATYLLEINKKQMTNKEPIIKTQTLFKEKRFVITSLRCMPMKYTQIENIIKGIELLNILVLKHNVVTKASIFQEVCKTFSVLNIDIVLQDCGQG